MSRVCACPREESMDGMPAAAVYRYGGRCRQAAYRARVKAEAEKAHLPVAASFAAIEARTPSPTNGRNGDGVRARSGRQISYAKAVRWTAAAIVAGRRDPERDTTEIAAEFMESALPPRQRP